MRLVDSARARRGDRDCDKSGRYARRLSPHRGGFRRGVRPVRAGVLVREGLAWATPRRAAFRGQFQFRLDRTLRVALGRRRDVTGMAEAPRRAGSSGQPSAGGPSVNSPQS